jgi:tetratricopeptide (TPR) repeat protein
MSEQPAGSGVPLSRHAALAVLTFVVVCRPITGGLLHTAAETASTGLLLLVAALLWVTGEIVAGALRVPVGAPALLALGFLAAAALASCGAPDAFAGYRWSALTATYALTAWLAVRLFDTPARRRFAVACLTATAAALAAYSLFHRSVYGPALREWLNDQPELLQALTRTSAAGIAEWKARGGTYRATGNFVSPAQLGAFLTACLLPLAGTALEAVKARRRVPRHRLLWPAAFALPVGLVLWAAWLTGSNGVRAALAFGLAVMALDAWRVPRARALKRVLLALVVTAALLVSVSPAIWRRTVLGYGLRSLGPPGESFDRRLSYWETGAPRDGRQLLLGIGPGGWADNYALHMQPEQEETSLPHGVYAQVAAGTGWLGLGLFVLAVCAALTPPRPPGEPARRPAQAGAGRVPVSVAGPLLAAAALGADCALLGTFVPPPAGVPPWLATAPVLPYAMLYLVWCGTYALVGSARVCEPGAQDDAPAPDWVRAGLWGAVAAMLAHAAVESVLDVPAVGGTAAVVAALLVAGPRTGRRPRPPLRGRPAAVAWALTAAALLLWAAVVAPAAIDHGLSLNRARRLRAAAISASGRHAARAARLAVAASSQYQRACVALPWEARAWRDLAAWLVEAPAAIGIEERPAEAWIAARQAAELAPLHAAHWALLGRVHERAGRMASAAACYRRACERRPSLPQAWYCLARVAERLGRDREAARSYGRAADLVPRQFHARNAVLGPPAEIVRMWAETTGPVNAAPGPPPGQLRLTLDAAWELGTAAGALDTAQPETDREQSMGICAGLPRAGRLLRGWDTLRPAEREALLWTVCAPRLWEWALRVKAAACAMTAPDPHVQWSQRRGSNPQPRLYESRALPLSYAGSRPVGRTADYTAPRTAVQHPVKVAPAPAALSAAPALRPQEPVELHLQAGLDPRAQQPVSQLPRAHRPRCRREQQAGAVLQALPANKRHGPLEVRPVAHDELDPVAPPQVPQVPHQRLAALPAARTLDVHDPDYAARNPAHVQRAVGLQ